MSRAPDASLDEAAPERSGAGELHWQSQAVMVMVLPAAAVWLVLLLLRLPAGSGVAAGVGLLAGVALAVLVRLARAATAAGALTGGLLMGCFCLTTPGWHSSAWPLVVMLGLTLGATRAGRTRRRPSASPESEHEARHGRSAAQVAANLGAAALAGTLINAHGQGVALTVLLASLCEAAADTLASELGQALGGTPRLITSLAPVLPGTDGGVTWAGTAIGAMGAAVIALAGVLAMGLPAAAGWIAAAAGIAGLLFDSLLGAVLERRGWLNNDAVNFLSTVFAGAVALGAAESLR